MDGFLKLTMCVFMVYSLSKWALRFKLFSFYLSLVETNVLNIVCAAQILFVLLIYNLQK